MYDRIQGLSLQYMPKKPSKWGLKDWVLDGSDSGYAYDWMLYTGTENVCTKRQSGKSCIANAHRILLLAREERQRPVVAEDFGFSGDTCTFDFTQW